MPDLKYAVCDDGTEFLFDAEREAVPTHVNAARVVSVKNGPVIKVADDDDGRAARAEALKLLQAARPDAKPAAAGGDEGQ